MTSLPPIIRRPVKTALAVLAGTILLAGLVSAAWWGWLEDRIIPKRWGVVEEGCIYRSARLPPALLARQLDAFRIRCIVDLTFPDPADARQAAEKALAAERGIAYFNYPLYGSGVGEVSNYAHTLSAMARAQREGEPLLVHCHAGVQRSGGVVAAYRLLIQRRAPTEVRAELARYGWNPEKDRVLPEFLDSRMAELAEALKEMGMIEAVPVPLPSLR